MNKQQLHVTASLMTVTPELASEWLAEKWGEQRNIRDKHVYRLRDDMANRRWRVSPDAILRIKGKLANGQHRLSAVVDYGKPVQFIVMESNDDELYKVVDSGLKRTVSDALISKPYAQHMPPIARWVIGYESNNSSKIKWKNPATHSETIDYCLQNEDELSEAASVASGLYATTRLLPVSVGGAFYIIGKRAGELEKTKSFLDAVYKGETVSSSSGSREYRNRLINNRGSKAKLSPVYIFGLGIKALKSHISGEKVSVLKWADMEELPKI